MTFVNCVEGNSPPWCCANQCSLCADSGRVENCFLGDLSALRPHQWLCFITCFWTRRDSNWDLDVSHSLFLFHWKIGTSLWVFSVSSSIILVMCLPKCALVSQNLSGQQFFSKRTCVESSFTGCGDNPSTANLKFMAHWQPMNNKSFLCHTMRQGQHVFFTSSHLFVCVNVCQCLMWPSTRKKGHVQLKLKL